MKTYNKLIILALGFFIINACNQNYIDEISKVNPGADASAPVIKINSPVEGFQIQLPEVTSAVNIDFEASDDIELGSVKVMYDGTEIASFTDFRDYRKLIIDTLTYRNVVNGTHKLTIVATDLENKTTSKEVNFAKVPAYVPKYPGEVLYMPFDGSFMNMVSFDLATIVSTPGFADDKIKGSKSYKGATGSYLSLPAEDFQNNEFSAIFWMKINAVPDRAGILVMGPVDAANPTAQNNRTSGFRFFRENTGGKQRFKLNVGNGIADTWVDGGAAADVDPAINEWVHMAFTITATKAIVYIDGQIVKESDLTGLDWTGCDVLSIMSGDPRFSGWNHHSDLSLMDELRIFDRTLSQEEIQGIITEESGKDFTYIPKYDGEIFYLPFEDDFLEYVSQDEATIVGSPGFAAGKVGKAYSGSVDSYLTFPTEGLTGNQFSAAFWMKIQLSDPAPTYGHRAGVLIMGPPDPDKPETPNNRKNGFRFFREGSATAQIFKLNSGNGTADVWFDGGTAATVNPSTGSWRHYAFTISGTECVVYIDGEVVKQGAFGGIDWTGCDILSIMSGAPRFLEWNHWSDESLMDELRLFNKALTQAEVQAIIADEN